MHFIECLRKMLLEHNDKVINMHHTSFSYCREMKVYWEPWAVPKQKIMWAVIGWFPYGSNLFEGVWVIIYYRQVLLPIGIAWLV